MSRSSADLELIGRVADALRVNGASDPMRCASAAIEIAGHARGASRRQFLVAAAAYLVRALESNAAEHSGVR